ncbi:MAG: beta-ketoacyl synthase chain length factor [Sinobacteraceae bacterium]|nr:beta-ketoacyl synthase chain length factor [Nevskiaceae bacterium]
MIEVRVDAVGFIAPGLCGWEQTRAVLRGEAAHEPAELPPYKPGLLPPNERRRAPPAVCQAFRVAEDAFSHSALPASQCTAIFTSSEADTNVVYRINKALATATRVVSPIDFHNTVHNAAAGYWSIAVSSHQGSNSICAYDWSFAAGLLEAATLCAVEERPTLLVAYDIPVPDILKSRHPISIPAGTALVLLPAQKDESRSQLRITCTGDAPQTQMSNPQLEALRLGNPAARSLPLLELLALGKGGHVGIENGATNLLIEVSQP